MNIATLQSFSDLGLKIENSPQLISNPTMFSFAGNAAQVQNMARPGTISASLTNVTPSTSFNSSTNTASLIAATTSAMLQGLPQNSNLDKKTRERVNYLQQLLKDKKQCQLYPNIFLHVERLLDEEIVKVRSVLFQNGEKQPLELPAPQGPTITLTEKMYVPVKDHPEFNFVGRLLGPRGLTAKQLEQDTKCKIMVRGKGSMRDKKKEDMNRGKPNWEHLSDELHVLITVEDTENRARVKMQRAKEEIEKLLVPTQEGEDELKKKQLMELAIINGTYRDYSTVAGQPRLVTAPQLLQGATLPTPAPSQPSLSMLGNPIFSRLPNGQALISNGVGQAPPVLAQSDGSFLYYTPVDCPPITLPEYVVDPASYLGAATGAGKLVRHAAPARAQAHPYQRPPAPPTVMLGA